jgi:hypothetical protein
MVVVKIVLGKIIRVELPPRVAVCKLRDERARALMETVVGFTPMSARPVALEASGVSPVISCLARRMEASNHDFYNSKAGIAVAAECGSCTIYILNYAQYSG